MTDYQEQPPVANPNPRVPPQQYYSPPPRDPRYNEDPRRKSQGLAMFLSLMPGLGQVYVGYYQQGFINIVVVASLIALLDSGVGALDPLGGLFLAFFWLYNIIDAGRRAAAYNQSLIGLDEAELPENLASSSTTGAPSDSTIRWPARFDGGVGRSPTRCCTSSTSARSPPAAPSAP